MTIDQVAADVVVVGSGGGALTGAYLAQRAGLSTVVLERTDLCGGTSAYSGGALWLPGSEVQQRAGLPDSTESARGRVQESSSFSSWTSSSALGGGGMGMRDARSWSARRV